MDTHSSAPVSPSPSHAGALPPISGLLRAAWQRYQGNWRLWALIMLPPAVIGMVQILLFPLSQQGEVAVGVYGPTLLFFVLLVAMIVVQIVSTLALLVAVHHPTTAKDAYLAAKSFILPYLIISLLTGLAVLGGFILLIVPGIIFAIWFSFAPFVLIDEGVRNTTALRRSKALVSGRWWGVFGRVVVLIVLAIVVSAAAGVLPDVISTFMLPLILTPFATLYMYEIYKGLKAEKIALTS